MTIWAPHGFYMGQMVSHGSWAKSGPPIWDIYGNYAVPYGPRILMRLMILYGPSHLGPIWDINVLTWAITMGFKWASHVGPI